MPPRSLSSFSPSETFLRLPHPYLTNYVVHPSSSHQTANTSSDNPGESLLSQDATVHYFALSPHAQTPFEPSGSLPPFPLHRPDLSFSPPANPVTASRPAESNNTAWGRARRCPSTTFVWGYENCPISPVSNPTPDGRRRDCPPDLAQFWLLIYAVFTHRQSLEAFRLRLLGPGHDRVANLLTDTLIAVPHPKPAAAPGCPSPGPAPGQDLEVLVLRAAFWQGAASPFGSRPAWLPSPPDTRQSLPPLPLLPTLTYPTPDSTASRPIRHPMRPPKPAPGSVIYSRWIPYLCSTISMVVLDPSNQAHLSLFHKWQNDPRVSAGWNESGTLDHHRGYLETLASDPSQMPLLAYWDVDPFAYFEVYWGAEDRLGPYYGSDSAKDFDRGRHSLVGEVKFRGPHRVTAWWGSLIHYLFLDEPRTMRVVGEPKASNGTVLMYDFMAGFSMSGFADLPHKRSAMVMMGRERFFEICPLGGEGGDGEGEIVVGGTGVGLVPKL